MSASESEISRAVMLLVSGASVEKAVQYFINQFRMEPENAAAVVQEARRQLTLAADFVRDEQLGTAIARLNNLYTKAIEAEDIKTALQAQKELNKLMDLYRPASGGGGSEDETHELRNQMDLIERYILPLKLTDERYPIEEHVRVAAEIIRENKIRTSV